MLKSLNNGDLKKMCILVYFSWFFLIDWKQEVTKNGKMQETHGENPM